MIAETLRKIVVLGLVLAFRKRSIAEYPKGKKKPHIRDKCMAWVRDVYKVVEPFAVRDEGHERDEMFELYGDLYGNMKTVNRLRDPDNVFSLNRNLLPK